MLKYVQGIVFVIVITFMAIAEVLAAPHQCPVLAADNLSDNQIRTLYNAFQVGRAKDMSYSLAAIAWKESSGGKYLINLQDPSAGAFHITVNNALSYLKWPDNSFNRNRVAQLLIQDFDLAAEFAMINLQFWKDVHGDNWFRIWASYNAGYNWRNGESYAHDIAAKIQKIRLCGWS